MSCIKTFALITTIVLLATSLSGQTTFYVAKYSIKNENAQDQYYKVEQNGDVITIQERGVFLSNPDIYAYSEAKLDSLGYLSVKIAFDNGEIKSTVRVSRASQCSKQYYSYLNGTLVDSIWVEDSTVILFDGPNPTFDVLNSRFLEQTILLF